MATQAELAQWKVIAQALPTMLRIKSPDELRDWYYLQAPTERDRMGVTWVYAVALEGVRVPLDDLVKWSDGFEPPVAAVIAERQAALARNWRDVA